MITKAVFYEFIKKYWAWLLIVGSAFLFYLLWSMHIPMNLCPDEYMRFDVPLWILRNHRLPIGNETELLNPIWGTSYAFSPYFPSIVAVFFMKIAACFSNDYNVLLHAARLVSVICGTLTVLLCLFIGRELFKRSGTKFLFAVLVGFLPQFAFLSSYLNNDVPSVCFSALILFSWVKGMKSHWDLKSCVLLGIGIAFESMTYYFSYAWIVLSVVVPIVSVFMDDSIKMKHVFLAKRTGLVFGIFMILAGWYFARNFYIYDGDILGSKFSSACAEINALPEYKPSAKANYKTEGLGFSAVLFNRVWHKISVYSFLCVFGYMSIYANFMVYKVYFVGVAFGVAMCAIFFIGKRSKFRKKTMRENNLELTSWNEIILMSGLILAMIIPYCLSMYFTWSWDYQPQGRYFMSALIPLMYLSSYGYEILTEKTQKYISKQVNLSVFIGLSYIELFFYVLFSLIIPNCWGN
ncbi:MAG: phospholipid carrier-dependent glycosyltransferase [Treponema sp.]|nr:phospholipid carrier-dependent glycosyltransferase [Treponema sp.]